MTAAFHNPKPGIHPGLRFLPVFAVIVSIISIASADVDPAEHFNREIWPIMGEYCADCHSGGVDKGDFDIDEFPGRITDTRSAEKWHEVINVINEGRMPPEDEPQPEPGEKVTVVKWVGEELERAEIALAGSGRGVLRRMNRREYENTIEDLIGVPPRGVEAFAKDGKVEGLDNQGQGLFMSPYQMERYLDSALATLDSAIPDGTWPFYRVHFEGEAMEYDPHEFVYAHRFPDPIKEYERKLTRYEKLPEKKKRNREPPEKREPEQIAGEKWAHKNDPPTEIIEDRGIIVYHPINSRAQLIIAGAKLLVPLDIPKDGWYRARLVAGAGPETPWDRSTLTVGLFEFVGGRGGAQNRGHNPVFREEVRGAVENPGTIEKLVWLEKGERIYYLHKGNLGWETDVYDQTDQYEMIYNKRIPRKEYWRGLFVDSFTLEGPLPAPAGNERLFPGGLEEPFTREKARAALARLAAGAFRRPVTDEEVEPYLRFHDGTDRASFVEGVRKGAAMILSSPKFLYLVEPSAESDRLGPRELANRLSYFLWNQNPDDRLLELAGRGELTDPEVLREEVRRLLDDHRGGRFIRSFARGWLGLDRLDTVIPDRRRFPTYTFDMPESLVEQTTAFVERILDDDRSALEIIDSDWDMLNAKLARYYRLDHLEIEGTELRPVELGPGERNRLGGVLGHASILAMTANGTRTSPIIRGAWIVDHLLGDPPPPPPPSVSALEEVEGVEDVASLPVKELIELHNRDPDCAACHDHFDPYGIAFENYDPAGLWRDHHIRFASPKRGNRAYQREKVAPIDAAGELVDGTTFDGPNDMKAILLDRKDEFARHLVEKLLAYALGRPVDFADRGEVRRLETAFAESGYRFAPLIEAIVLSDTFHRR